MVHTVSPQTTHAVSYLTVSSQSAFQVGWNYYYISDNWKDCCLDGHIGFFCFSVFLP